MTVLVGRPHEQQLCTLSCEQAEDDASMLHPGRTDPSAADALVLVNVATAGRDGKRKSHETEEQSARSMRDPQAIHYRSIEVFVA